MTATCTCKGGLKIPYEIWLLCSSRYVIPKYLDPMFVGMNYERCFEKDGYQ